MTETEPAGSVGKTFRQRIRPCRQLSRARCRLEIERSWYQRVMPSTADLLDANLHRVFGNRDAASRSAAIREVFAPDAAFIDPDETVVGWEAVEAKAAGLIDPTPESFVFAEYGPRYIDGDFGALAWSFGPAGSPVARGIDLITVVDGRISELRTVLVDATDPQ